MSSSDDLPGRNYYDSWHDLRDALLEAANEDTIWRGVSDCSWCILTSVDRFAAQHGIHDRTALEARLLDLYQEKSGELGLEGDGTTPQQRWALGQHWGLPTPFLDWSHSPMVGAFFAASSTNPEPESERTLAIYALETGSFRNPGDTSLVNPPSGPWNSRMRAQQGLFTDLRVGGCLIDTLRDRGQLDSLRVYLCPASDSAEVLVDLESMTVSALTMFPDMEGVVRQVRTLAARKL